MGAIVRLVQKVLPIYLIYLCIAVIGTSFPAAPVRAQASAPAQVVSAQAGQTKLGENASSTATSKVFMPDVRSNTGSAERESVAITLDQSAQTALCTLYPIALHANTLAGVAPGQEVKDIFNGAQPGNFGWLSWNGDNGVPSLITSLTPPGNSSTYTNPNNPSDHSISSGDWVRGRPGVANASGVRAALDQLKSQDITVPLWDLTTGNGSNARYRVVGFARVRLLDYRLPSQNRISARYVGGDAACTPQHAPVANPDSYETYEDEVLDIGVPGVLGNDTDSDGNPLTAVIVTGPSHGTLALQLNGSFRYTPAANFHGSDSFTYQAKDGALDSNLVTVTIEVRPTNDLPRAVDDPAQLNEDGTIAIAVLANDSDLDGDTLAILTISNPAHGVAVAKSDGTVGYAPAANYCGADGFDYTVADGRNGTADAKVTITVICVNDAPIANDDTASTARNASIQISVLDNDHDADLDLLKVTETTTPLHGAALATAGQTVSYTPASAFRGEDIFHYTVCDPLNLCAEATIVVVVGGANRPPLAVDDSAETLEDVDLAINVKANDLDEDGTLDLSSVAMLAPPKHGTVHNAGDGTFDYTPDANFHDTDSFNYKICDDEGLCASATVTVIVTAVNDVPVAGDDEYQATEDRLLTIVAPGPLANDSDVDGDDLSVAISSQPSHGALTQNGDGSFTYMPAANYCGPDQFTYRADDGSSTSAVADVSLAVACVNDVPVAVAGTYSVDEDTTLTVAAPGVLDGASDREDDALIAILIAGASQGVLDLQADGSFTYKAAADFYGQDSFTYQANDGAANSNVANVTIVVNAINDAPIAEADAYSVDEDKLLTVAAPGVLANDSDIEGESLMAVQVVAPAHGTLALQPDGSFAYTPEENFHGIDTFTYEANDSDTASNAVTVMVTVNPVNDPPVAVADAAQTDEDVAATFDVMANDSDADEDVLTVVAVASPQYGTAEENANGSVHYVPNANYCGEDSFDYTLSDDHNEHATASVTIDVVCINDMPIAHDDTAGTAKNVAVTIPVLDNDHEPEGETLSVQQLSSPAHGTVATTSEGGVRYTPATGFSGEDTFTYEACDPHNLCATATVRVVVGSPNVAPVAVDDEVETGEEVAITIAVADNDSDEDGNLAPATAAVLVASAHGSLTDEGDGTFVYTPAPNFHGADSFTYQVCDEEGLCDSAVVAISVTPINDPPVAGDDTYEAVEDTPLAISAPGVLTNDSDVDHDTLSVAGNSQPAHGTLTQSPDGSFTYTPFTNYCGSDGYDYTLSDGHDGEDTATVTIAVACVNDKPSALDDSYTTGEDTPLSVDAKGILQNDSDVDGNTLSVATHTEAAHGALTQNANGSFTYTPPANYCGPDSYTYVASDGLVNATQATVAILVTCVNDLPVAVADAYATDQETVLTIAAPGLLANDADDDNEPLTAIVATGPSHGTLQVQPNGSFEYTPASGFSGEDSFNYMARDGVVESSAATVRITVHPAPSGLGVIAGEVFNDATGLLLAGATVQLLSLDGVAVDPPQQVTSDKEGRFAFVSNPGLAALSITAPNYTSAYRLVELEASRRATPYDARLTALDSNGATILSIAGGTVTDQANTATLELPQLALADDSQIVVTPISSQGLIGPLPLGWSPVAVVDIAPGGLVLAEDATLSTDVPSALPTGALIYVARWDETSKSWIAAGQANLPANGEQLQIGVKATGQYVFLLADSTPATPPAPVEGQPIVGVGASSLPNDLAATLKPSPRILFARPGARSDVRVEATSATAMPSGIQLQIERNEAYTFTESGLLMLAPVAQDVTLYAYPQGAHALQGELTVTPSRFFNLYELQLGAIDLAARLPAQADAALEKVVEEGGGQLTAPTGEQVVIPAAATDKPLAVRLLPLGAAIFASAIPTQTLFLGGIWLDLHGGQLDLPATLAIKTPGGSTQQDQVLVVRRVEVDGKSYLALVAMGQIKNGQLVTNLDPTGDGFLPLPGIREEGQYAFLKAKNALGFVTGLAAGTSGQPLAGALLTASTTPIVAVATASADYVLAAPLGNVQVTATDPNTHNELVNSGTIAAKNSVLTLDFSLTPTPPRVASLLPANGATKVSRLSTIQVTFSEPLDAATVTTDSLRVLNGATLLPGTLSLSPGNRVLTFQPTQLLNSDTTYSVTVAATVRDLSGLSMVAPFTARFTTVDDTPPPPPAAGTLQATIPNANGISIVTGSQGTTEPGWIVTIRNLTTNAITAVLPEANGSFRAEVAASLADKLELVMLDKAKNETRVPLPRFENPDGSVVVGSDGGAVTGDGGVAVEIPADALPDGTVVKVEPATLADFDGLTAPPDLPFFGALKLDLGGVLPTEHLDIAIPAPADATITDTVLVARAVQVAGQQQWSLIDTAHLENGKYVTASPPFPGVDVQGNYAFFKPKNIIVPGANGHLDTEPLSDSDDLYSQRPLVGQVIIAGPDGVLHTEPEGDDELRPECISFVTFETYVNLDALIFSKFGFPFFFPITNRSEATIMASCNQDLKVTVVAPDTGATLLEVSETAPAGRNQIYKTPTIITNDHERPTVLASVLPTHLYSNTQEILIRFSENMRAESFNMLTITDPDHDIVNGTVQALFSGTVLSFRPQIAFKLEKEYTIHLDLVTDPSRNTVDAAPIVFKRAAPQPLVELGDFDELFERMARCPQSQEPCYFSSQDTVLISNTLVLANGLRTPTEQYLDESAPARIAIMDVITPTQPRLIGWHETTTDPRAVAVLLDVSFPYTKGNSTKMQFAGDILVVIGGGRSVTNRARSAKMEIYDITNCMGRLQVDNCLAELSDSDPKKPHFPILQGMKFLSTGTDELQRLGVPPEPGVAMDLAVLHQRIQRLDEANQPYRADTAIAYAVVTPIGIEAVDIAKALGNIESTRPSRFGIDGLYRGGFFDVAMLKNGLAAVEETPTGRGRFRLFTASLLLVDEVNLLQAFRVATVENLVFDLDGDGNLGTAEHFDDDNGDGKVDERDSIGASELFDLAVVASGGRTLGEPMGGDLYVVDVSHLTDLAHPEAFSDPKSPDNPRIIAQIPMPGAPFAVCIDREAQVAYVDLVNPLSSDYQGVAVVDLSHLLGVFRGTSSGRGLIDLNNDAIDDRILYVIQNKDKPRQNLKGQACSALDAGGHNTGMVYLNWEKSGPELLGGFALKVGDDSDAVTAPVRMESDIDTITGNLCQAPAFIRFAITHDAAVTIRIEGQIITVPGALVGSKEATLAANGLNFPAGVHEVPIPPQVVVNPGEHKFEIKAVFVQGDAQTGTTRQERTITGIIQHEILMRGTFPIAHTMVEGVDLWDGHLTHGSSDLDLPGRGPALAFNRTYSSGGSDSSGPLGAGWSHNLDVRLLRDGCGRYVVVGGEGSGNAFTAPAVDAAKLALFTSPFFTPAANSLFYTPSLGYHSTLIRDGSNANRFDFFTTAHIRYHFEREGQMAGEVYTLRFIEDPTGNRLTFDYLAIDNDPQTLDVVTDSAGRSLRLNYREIAGSKRITKVVGDVAADPNDLMAAPNIDLAYQYDAIGNLVVVTRTTPYAAYDFQDERIEHYQYATENPNDGHNLIGYTDPNGHLTSYSYYAITDNIAGYNVNFLVSKDEMVRAIHKPEGVSTSFDYTISTDPGTPNLRSVDDPRPAIGPTLYTLNQYGATVRIDAPLGKSATFVWCTDLPLPSGCARRDAIMAAETDALGRTKRYTYDEQGNITSATIDFSGMSSTLYRPVTNAQGEPQDTVSSYVTYDPLFNLPTSKTDAKGNTIYFCLDSPAQPPPSSPCQPQNGKSGNLLAMIDAERNRTEYIYATAADIQGGNYGPGDLKEIINPRQKHLYYRGYDAYGNVISLEDAKGNVTTSVYDARSRLIESYDSFGHHALYRYDGLDRAISEAHLDDRGEGGLPQITVYRYTPNGEVRSMTTGLTDPNQFGQANAGHTTEFDYDQLNRQVTRSERQVLQADGSRVDLVFHSAYDEASNLIGEGNARGITQTHSYDALSHLVATTLTGPDSPNDVVIFAATYDTMGNQMSETDLHGYVTRMVYDGLYRPVETHLPFAHSYTDVPSQQAIVRTGYDEVGNKVFESDANGRTTRYEEYDHINRLKQVTDADGNTVKYVYDEASNKLSEEAVSSGLITEFEYDDINRPVLMRKRGPGLPSAGYETVYNYQDADNALLVTNPRQITTRIDNDGLDRLSQTIADVDGLKVTTTRTYDLFGNVATIKDGQNDDVDLTYLYDELGRNLSISYIGTPSDNDQPVREEYVYDGSGNIIQYTDKRGLIHRYTFDNLERSLTETLVESISNGGRELLLSETQYVDGLDSDGFYQAGDPGVYQTINFDANRNATRTDYDSLERPISVDDPGAVGVMLYEHDGVNLRSQIDKRGNLTRFSYDEINRLTLTEEYDGTQTSVPRSSFAVAYADEQRQMVETDRRGMQTISQNDALGRLLELRHAALDMALYYGQAQVVLERYAYDGNNNVVAFYDGQNNLTTWEYDSLDRKHVQTDGAGSPVEATTTWTYDSVGNVLTEKDGRAHGGAFDEQYAYDARYRQVAETNGANETTRYTYDADDNVVTISEPLGAAYTTHYVYDELGQLLAVDETPRANAGTPAGVTRYIYDANRNKLAQQDANGNLTTYRYDTLDRLIDTFEHTVAGELDANSVRGSDPRGQLLDAGGDAASALHWHYDYDANDNQTLIVDAEGQQVTLVYDYLNRLVQRRYSHHTDTSLDFQSQAIGYAYDGNGNNIAITETKTLSGAIISETTAFRYDPLDRLRTRTRLDYDALSGKSIAYAYDIQGNRTVLTDTDGITTTYLYDQRNRLATVTNEAGITEYRYWEDDLLKMVIYPNFTVQDRSFADSYDRADRIARIENRRLGPVIEPYSTYRYSYDANSNRATQIETQKELGGGSAETTSYTYDKLNRLASVDYGARGSVLYTYDANGNRLSERGTDPQSGDALNRTFVYDALPSRPGVTFDHVNALSQIVDHLNPAATVTYEYDGNLNQITKLQGSERSDYRYNIRDQMVAATVDDATTRFDYDDGGLRVKKISTTDETRYLYDDDSVLVEVDGDGQTTHKYDYGDGLLALTSVDNGSRESSFYLTDALQSVVNLAAANSDLIHSYRYDAWGNVLEEQGTSDNRRQYTGHFHDIETGLDYFGARYYDSEIGRFLSQDPYLGEADTPPSLHRYLYAYANPLRYVDLTGYAAVAINSSGGRLTTAVQSGESSGYEQSGYSVTKQAGTNYTGLDITLTRENPFAAGVDVAAIMLDGLNIFVRGLNERVAEGIQRPGAVVQELLDTGFEKLGLKNEFTQFISSSVATAITYQVGKIFWGSPIGKALAIVNKAMAVVNAYVDAGGGWAGLENAFYEHIGVNAAVRGWKSATEAWERGDYLMAYSNAVDAVMSVAPLAAKVLKFATGAARVATAFLPSSRTVASPSVQARAFQPAPVRAAQPAQTMYAKFKPEGPLKSRVLKAPQNIIGGFAVRTISCRTNSFSADTPVATDSGLVAISEIEVGDHVLAYHEALGSTDFYTVTATMLHMDPVVVVLTVDGEQIETTPAHPFYSEEGAWVNAGQLEVGSRIRKDGDDYGTVQAIQFVERAQPMYNLAVTGAHTFYVGDERWLVHNECDPDHHNANVRILIDGKTFFKERYVSGYMTAKERRLGFPLAQLSSHTEARGMKMKSLFVPGSTVIVTGQLPPCSSCKGKMNEASRRTGATIIYQWRENGKTRRWPAEKSK